MVAVQKIEGLVIELEPCRNCGEFIAQWADVSGHASICHPCYKNIETALQGGGLEAVARFLERHTGANE